MSYILDALNKSERERTEKKAPDISALQDTGTENKGITLKGYLLLLVVVVIVNVGILYLWLGAPESIPLSAAVTEAPPAPAIEITAHIYAEEPDLRLVHINGSEKKEGEFVSPGHQLIEITETGVKMSFEGNIYTLNVVEDWQLH